MRPLNDLIREYAKKNHPYAGPITKDEIAGLISGLRRRFSLSENEGDISPKSLILVENKMLDLHRRLEEGAIEYTEEDYVLMVREITAYLVQVLMVHSGGEIDSRSPDLWTTQVVMLRPTISQKGRERITSPRVVITVGNAAASAWDIMNVGKSPTLYKTYKMTKTKVIKQEL